VNSDQTASYYGYNVQIRSCEPLLNPYNGWRLQTYSGLCQNISPDVTAKIYGVKIGKFLVHYQYWPQGQSRITTCLAQLENSITFENRQVISGTWIDSSERGGYSTSMRYDLLETSDILWKEFEEKFKNMKIGTCIGIDTNWTITTNNTFKLYNKCEIVWDHVQTTFDHVGISCGKKEWFIASGSCKFKEHKNVKVFANQSVNMISVSFIQDAGTSHAITLFNAICEVESSTKATGLMIYSKGPKNPKRQIEVIGSITFECK
jgi:hypothetical protein